MSAPDNRESRVPGILKLVQGITSVYRYHHTSGRPERGAAGIVAIAKDLQEQFLGAFADEAADVVKEHDRKIDEPHVQRLMDGLRKAGTPAVIFWLIVAILAITAMFLGVPRWIAFEILRRQEVPPIGVSIMLGIVAFFAGVNMFAAMIYGSFCRRVLFGLPELQRPRFQLTYQVTQESDWQRVRRVAEVIRRSPLDIASMREGRDLVYAYEEALTDRALGVVEAERINKAGPEASVLRDHFRTAFDLGRSEEITSKKYEEFFDEARRKLQAGIQSAYRKALAAMQGHEAPEFDVEDFELERR